MEKSFCPKCSKEITTSNRLLKEECGHMKCRSCLILEDSFCRECTNNKAPKITILENIVIGSVDTSKEASSNKLSPKTARPHLIKYDGFFKCTICNKKFRSRNQQYYHLYCNEPIETWPHRCDICVKGFSSAWHLKYHMTKHNKEKLSCGICLKEFSNKITLNKHTKRHNEKLNFICNICNAQYKDESSFKTHMKSHENIFENICEICDKTFSSKSNLTKHLLVHIDRNKIFNCTYCDRKFYRNSTLKEHLQKHLKSDNYKCDHCKKHFSDDKALKRHMNLHNANSIYQCQFCDVKSVRKDNLFRHIRNMHPNDNETNSIRLIENKNNSLAIVETKDNNSNITEITKNENDVEKNNLEEIMRIGSVIKSIGNVPPLKIIEDIDSKQCNISDTQTVVSNIAKNNLPVLANKKLKKKYDPTEIYRKILFVSNDDESNTPEDDNYSTECNQAELQKTASTSNGVDNINLNHSNFIEKHWRKNFYM